MKKKVLYLSVAIGLICVFGFTGCGKKKKITYGDIAGVATGKIDLSKDEPDIDVDNILVPVGSDIDYTSGVEVVGDDKDYSVKVNATNVKNDKPGTYTVGYEVTSGGKTYTSNVKVTVTDDKSVEKGTVKNEIISSSTTENIIIDSNGQSQVENGDTGLVTQPTKVPSANTSATEEVTQQQTTTERELITGKNPSTVQNAKLDNAVIELLSGDVVTISCTTKKYIVATRTDESVVNKNGSNYAMSKLVVVFNTGEERTLETIEKKID